MELKAEKRLFVALGAVALVVVLLLPFVFRELEPDYQAAYSMDPAKRRRFAAKDEKPPEPPAVAAAASASLDAGLGGGRSPHRLAPGAKAVAGSSTPAPAAATATPATGEGGASSSARAASPRLKPVPGAASGPGAVSGTAPTAGGEALEVARFSPVEPPKTRQLGLVSGAAGAARLAEGLGLKGVSGLALAGGAQLEGSRECAEASAELKPRIAGASAEYERASSDLKAASCPADACGRYASDCALKDRDENESAAARRRCECDRRACRKDEACRALDELRCEQEKACSMGRPVSCPSSC
ncbi:MAG: hypothetical protein SF051_14465 [Elusimicrobiota bacterium]|nr:hypothetical protein [Elusimicrobiota bacterium]